MSSYLSRLIFRLPIIVLCFGLFFGLSNQVANAASPAESIISFDASATIEQDRTLTVTETILYDFGSNEKHGIFRIIPETYSRNGG
jgi:hypothetical protein